MNELFKKVQQFVKDDILNFNNFKEQPDFEMTEDNICARLFARKWSGHAQTETAKEITRERVHAILEKDLPMVFIFCFGGYKHFWTEAYPEPDWAEIFTMKYLIEYIYPILKKWDKEVVIEYESEEVFVDMINNMPRKAIDTYRDAFYKLLNWAQNKIDFNLKFRCVLARDLYNMDELLKITKNYEPAVAERLRALDPVENKIRLKRAATNFMWNGEKDYSNLTDKEKDEVVFQSRVTNEAFLDADYDLRGKSYFEKENHIPIVGTFGLGFGGDTMIHVMSTSASLVDFWAGIGVLEVRENKIIKKIISQNQFEKNKHKLIKVPLNIPELKDLGKNFSYIYACEGMLDN